MTFTETWQQADPDTQGGGNDLDPPADGLHDIALSNASAFIARTSGKEFVKLELTVVSQKQQGYGWTVLLGFKSQEQANITKRAIRSLGIDVDAITSIDDLNTAVGEKIGQYYTVEVKTNGQFRNTYITDTRPVGSDIPSDMETVPTSGGDNGDGDEPVPF